MLYGGPLGTYLSGYHGLGSGTTSATIPSAATKSSGGSLNPSRISRYRTPTSYDSGSSVTDVSSSGNSRTNYYTPQIRRRYTEDNINVGNDEKNRFSSNNIVTDASSRYSRPKYNTTTMSSPPFLNSSQQNTNESQQINSKIDYKILYETEKLVTEKLRGDIISVKNHMQEMRDKIQETRQDVQPSNSEQRRYDRRIAEYEEEMKVLETLRAESEKLKAEHRALTRVISHLM